MLDLQLSAPQNVFLNQLDSKFRAYVGGFGSGKTFVGCIDLLMFAGRHPKVTQGYFAPTYSAIRDIFYPTIEEAGELLGYTVDVNVGNKEVHLYRGKFYYGTVICRSMDNPHTIVGFKIARALVDEIDILPKVKAENAWRKIMARLRLVIDGVVNSIGVTTTPEGFLFVHNRFASNPTESYSMVQASTYENQKYLPEDYIDTLLESYPEKIAKAYIRGEFVNMTSGSVYNNYDRELNDTRRTIISDEAVREPLYIGMDFNVGQMSAIVHVKDPDGPRAVDEIVNAYDTPEMIQLIQDRYEGHQIRVYPDASGTARKTVDASTSDMALLEQAGFIVMVNGSNPRIKDRVMSMNGMLKNNKGERRYLVNKLKCPTYADNLEQQVWDDNGLPDKKAKKDHTNDAGGYFISHDYPIEKPASNLKLTFAR